jgi:cytochrome bd-type quinol oxidase subunit 2
MQSTLDIELKPVEKLHSLLDEFQRRLMTVTLAAAGLLLLGICWFASEDVASFLKEHPRSAWIVVLAPVVASALYCYTAWFVYKRSQKIATTLRSFDAALAEIYQSSAVSRSQFLVFSGGVVLLAMILAGCIYLAVHSPMQDSNEDEVLMQVALPRTTHLSRMPIGDTGIGGIVRSN